MKKFVFILFYLAVTVFSLDGFETTEGAGSTVALRTTTNAEYTTEGRGTTDAGVTSQPQICSNENSAYFQTDPTSCSKYYFCANGAPPNVRYCPNGTYFDLSVCACNVAELVADCVPEPYCKPGETILKPIPQDCGAYILCANGKAALGRCPANLSFDPELLECNKANFVKCLNNNSVTDPTSLKLNPSRIQDYCFPVVYLYPE